METPVPVLLATLHPSPARRVLGILSLTLFGGILVFVALARPPAHAGWLVFLLVIGITALVLAERMRRATRVRLELTREALRDSEGRLLARIDDIVSVQRGAFAFKPSSGFTLSLKDAGARVWEPGLWWRFGRRLGVGGVTGSREGRQMAETIAALLSERRS